MSSYKGTLILNKNESNILMYKNDFEYLPVSTNLKNHETYRCHDETLGLFGATIGFVSVMCRGRCGVGSKFLLHRVCKIMVDVQNTKSQKYNNKHK